jgi:hypothetical protein
MPEPIHRRSIVQALLELGDSLAQSAAVAVKAYKHSAQVLPCAGSA